MLSRSRIQLLFAALDEELRAEHVVGEVTLCGGAVMCLVFGAREATRDVDAIFEPTAEIRAAAGRVADRMGVAADWLSDAAKGFFGSVPPLHPVLNLPNLRVWAPTAEYMLAMKSVSARLDSHDRNDVLFLIRHIGLDTPEAVLDIVARYYPRQMVPAKTQFLVEELFEEGVTAARASSEGRSSDTTSR
jgi:hypothetical protein